MKWLDRGILRGRNHRFDCSAPRIVLKYCTAVAWLVYRTLPYKRDIAWMGQRVQLRDKELPYSPKASNLFC
jgi:hypothetical protein